MLYTGSSTQAWLSPAERPENIDALINSVDRYNPQSLDTLHAYLDQQIKEGTYDGLANLATLKLYQFNPTCYNHEVAVNILIKALLALPYPDFESSLALLCEAPVPMDPTPIVPKETRAADEAAEKAAETPSPAFVPVQVPEAYLAGNIKDPLIVRLANVALLLRNAQFVQFWKVLQSEEYADVRERVKVIPTFEADVRRIVVETVAPSFKHISTARLARYLNLAPGELGGYISKLTGWSVEGEYVAIPPNADNEIKTITAKEQIEIEKLHKLLVQAQSTPLQA